MSWKRRDITKWTRKRNGVSLTITVETLLGKTVETRSFDKKDLLRHGQE